MRLLLAMLALGAELALATPVKAVQPFELPWMNAPEEGAIYKSSEQSDAVFVVEAYFLGCSYCNDNAPNVNALAEDYAGDVRVQVLDVGVDRNKSQYDTWIARHEPNHPVLMDAKRKLIGQLGTSGYPSTYVIDARGNVKYKTSGVWNAAKKAAIKSAINALLVLD